MIDFDQFDEQALRAISTGAAVSLFGTLVESQGSGQSVELQVESFKIIGAADPDAVQKTILQPKKHSLDFKEQAHLNLERTLLALFFALDTQHHLQYINSSMTKGSIIYTRQY